MLFSTLLHHSTPPTGGSVDPDAQTYFDTLDTAGYPLDASEQGWINNRVLNLKGTAAGSITSDATNVWDDLLLLVFYQYNAGAGDTAYAVIGGNAVDGGTPTWDANGFTPSDLINHDLAAALDVAVGVNAGFAINVAAEFGSFQNFSPLFQIQGFAARFRAQGGFKVHYGKAIGFTYPTGSVDFQFIAYDLQGESSGIPCTAKIDDGVTVQGWTDSAVIFKLPETSDLRTLTQIADKQQYAMKAIAVIDHRLTQAESDSIQAILNATT
ncbi:MAG: hypothetical protein HC799_19375 [Limnothrix sp. RL_2_0]|nr:hypothetical protein [Limnothrix sp. RL_2_0]